MKKMVISIVIAGVFGILIAIPQNILAASPQEDIKSTIDAILNILKDKELSNPSNTEKRRSTIRKLVKERFDFEEMAKRSLARHWGERTHEEKKNFVSVFSELLEASYIGKIEAYTDEKVSYEKEVIKAGNKYAVVSTTIVTAKVDIPIEYKVMNKKDRWMVYDVVIEGVSFISTYRGQYNQIIMKESFAKLLDEMKSKLAE